MDLLDGYGDRKDDGEFKKSAKQVVSSTNATQDAPRSGTVPSRKPLPTSTDDGKHGGAVSKDQHQPNVGHPSAAALSSSAASSVNAPPASKKRKQAGTSTSSATPIQAAATATATATAQATPSSNAAQRKPCSGVTGYPETNMMSFENCKGRPKNGILTADDGSLLAVNGKHTDPSFILRSELMRLSRSCLPDL